MSAVPLRAIEHIDIALTARQAMIALDRLDAAADDPHSFNELDENARLADAIQRAMRDVKDVSDRAGEVRVKYERTLGKRLEEIPKAKGASGPGRGKAGCAAGPAFNNSPTLASMGISKDRSAVARKLAAVPEKKIAAACAELKSEDKPISPTAVLKRIAPPREPAPRTTEGKRIAPVDQATTPFDLCIIEVRRRVFEALSFVPKSEWRSLFAELRAEINDLEQKNGGV